MTYNMTQLQNADTFYKITEYANNATGGVLMGAMMIAIFFVLLMLLKRYDFEEDLLVSSFISFILSLILTYAKLLNFMFPVTFLAIAALTALYVYASK